MSLDRENFLREFKQLEGSFSRSLSKHIREAWYLEVELTQFHIFKKTIRKLALGYHFTQKSSTFPRFKDFWTIYKLTEANLSPYKPEEKKPSCEKCVGGMIYFLKRYRNYPEPVEVVGFCRNCYPDKIGSLDPDDAYNYIPGMHPEHRRHEVVLPHETNRALYLEFMGKLMNPNTDWEAETERHLKLHRQTLEARGLA